MAPYAMYPEREVRDYLLKRLRQVHGKIRKVRWIGRRFAPDEMIWRPGWRFPKMAELKAPGRLPTQGQMREHARLRNFKIEVWVLDSFAAVEDFLASK